jgi:hypothetical protein
MNSSSKITLHAGKFLTLVKESQEWLQTKANSGLLIDPKVYAGLYFVGRRI